MAVVDNSTLFINITTKEYPVYLNAIRQVAFGLSNPVSLPQTPSEAQVNALGFAIVNPVAQPTGDVVTEGTPSESNGVYTQTWTTRSFTTAELAANLLAAQNTATDAVDAARDATFLAGYSYTFPDTTTQHVQMRDQDKINLLTILTNANALVAQNVTTAVIPFRTFENNDMMLTPAQAVTMCNDVIIYGQKVYQAAFTLKNQITAATTIADIPAVPATLTVS